MSHLTTRVVLIVALIATGIVTARVSLRLANAQTATRALTVRHDPRASTISVFRSGSRMPVLVEHAGAQTRPSIHPITAPDGTGVTGPGGLFWAFTDVNGRDFFHNSGSAYWRRESVDVTQATGEEVRWQTVYDLLDQTGAPVLTETARWSMREANGAY